MLRPRRPTPPLGPPRLDSKQRALAQWRGADCSAAEKAGAHTAQALGQIMPKVLSGLRIDQRRAEAEIVRVWNHLVDPTVAAHAQPTGLHKGTLFVSVDSHVWLDEIVRYRRKETLDRLQHSFGRQIIARISFRVEG
jgi:predicted nucleic acid-binding Zn ribbon protein